MISVTLLVPLATAVLLYLLPRKSHEAIRRTALFGSLVTLACSIVLVCLFRTDVPGYQEQLTEVYPWVESLGVYYRVGIDGFSLFMVFLTALLAPVCILCSWRSVTERVVEFHTALLLLIVGVIGVFVAMDLVLFYVFWEVMLIPMYLLIGMWGSGNRIHAAVKFFLYTLAGSLLMFLAIAYLYVHLAGNGVPAQEVFDITRIPERLKEFPLPSSVAMTLFLAFGLSFAIKVPLFPFHTWLPDAHTEAPTAGSVILAGVLLKMGVYGFVRFAIPFFPEAATAATPWICGLSVVGIVFGACMCLVQEDIKRLIAYSSVSHLGFVMLGIFAFEVRGVVGGILQMVNHGITTGALFLLVGAIYERRHTRQILDYGGIAAVVPKFAAIFFITTFASIGLPFLNGFVGEFLILQGTFIRSPAWAACAATGVVLGAVYMLILCRRFLLGPITDSANETLADLSPREMGYLVPFVLLMVFIGMFSSLFTGCIEPTAQSWLQSIQQP